MIDGKVTFIPKGLNPEGRRQGERIGKIVAYGPIPFLIRASLLMVLLLFWASSAPGQPAPETAAPKKGMLSILSDPGGAKVFINDVYQGKTPLHLSLPAGNYGLKLEKAGYKTVIEQVMITEGEDTTLDLELEEKE